MTVRSIQINRDDGELLVDLLEEYGKQYVLRNGRALQMARQIREEFKMGPQPDCGVILDANPHQK